MLLNQSIPTLMSSAEWQKGTYLVARRRSSELKALDEQIRSFERSASPIKAARVRQALRTWQRSKGAGDEWQSSSRNDNKTITLLDAQLRGKGDTDTALGAQSFMQPALINSRLGVLYLFGNTWVDDSIFKIALDGAVSITSSALTYAGKTENIGSGMKDASGNLNEQGLGLQKDIKTAGQAVNAGGKVAGKIGAEIEKRITSPKKQEVSSEQLAEDDDSPPTEPWLRKQFDKLVAKLLEMSEKLMATIREKIGNFRNDPSNALLSSLPGLIRKLVNVLVKRLLKASAPLIGSGLDLASGIANTIDSAVTRFREWSDSRGVEFLFGHPGTIVKAIRRAMVCSIGEGLYQSLKSGAKLGMEIASYGGSALINMIISIVETIAKAIWRIVELLRLRSFCNQAKQHWQSRGESSALHTQPVAFNNWYKSYAMSIPAIAVLTLNSGICADKMHFLSMFKDDQSVITQSQFDAGCQHVDSLKVWGSDYLGSTGFRLSSEDDVVAGLLKFSTQHKDTGPVSNTQKAWTATLGFLNG